MPLSIKLCENVHGWTGVKRQTKCSRCKGCLEVKPEDAAIFQTLESGGPDGLKFSNDWTRAQRERPRWISGGAMTAGRGKNCARSRG